MICLYFYLLASCQTKQEIKRVLKPAKKTEVPAVEIKNTTDEEQVINALSSGSLSEFKKHLKKKPELYSSLYTFDKSTGNTLLHLIALASPKDKSKKLLEHMLGVKNSNLKEQVRSLNSLDQVAADIFVAKGNYEAFSFLRTKGVVEAYQITNNTMDALKNLVTKGNAQMIADLSKDKDIKEAASAYYWKDQKGKREDFLSLAIRNNKLDEDDLINVLDALLFAMRVEPDNTDYPEGGLINILKTNKKVDGTAKEKINKMITKARDEYPFIQKAR